MALHLADSGSRGNCGCWGTMIRVEMVKPFACPSCNDMRKSFPWRIEQFAIFL